MSNLIVLKNIIKEFKNGENTVRVLDDINLTINKGEFISIIGASGSGKSTLMNLLGCLDTPSSGEYFIQDKSVKNLSKDELAELRREHFGFIFQRYHLINSINSCANVEIPAIYSGVGKDKRRERALSLLSYLGLEGKEFQKPNQLSGGQQQRVSIARSLMNGGDVILADEPTGALDSKNGVQVMELLKDLHNDGQTIIIVTHDPNIAKQTNRIIEISDGKIVSDILNNPNSVTHNTSNSTFPIDIPLDTDASLTHNVIENDTQSAHFTDNPENNIVIVEKDKVISNQPITKIYHNKSIFSFSHQFKEAFAMATNAILSHKIRSFLTMLGIIIGIASVVSVVALGEGSKIKILSNINSMGSNTIDIYPGTGWGDRRASQIKTLNEKDINLIKQQPYIDSVSANVSSNKNITYNSQEVTAQVMGVSEDFFRVKAFNFEQGSTFSSQDIKYQSQVIVIDDNTQTKLFGNNNAIGKIIFVGKVPLKVVGVLEKKSGGFGRANESLQLFVPYTTAMHRMFGVKHLASITVRIKDGINTQLAEQGLISLITRSHGGKQDFYTSNLDTIKQTIEQTTATMTLLISAIAIISLVVGGIGVMNIMLVSVTERTKEIGVRMAIGARESDIMKQFLIEAILVCLIGGSIGIILSLGIGYLFNTMSSDFQMIFSTASIITAFLCSSAIGMIFGFIPARNAAKLDPIVALVQE